MNSSEDDKTKQELAKELLTPGYSARAHHRASRRKSPWNLLLVLTVILGIGSCSVALVWITDILIQLRGMPPLFSENNPEWIRIVTTCGSFIVSIPFGMVAGNFLVWLIPPARRALDAEASGHRGTDYETSQRQLTYIGRYLTRVYRWVIGQF